MANAQTRTRPGVFGKAQKVNLGWDFEGKHLNGIQFGDPIDGAAQFGLASSSSETASGKSIVLTFARSGLFLEFDLPTPENPNYSFDYFGVLVGPDPHSQTGIPIDYTSLTLLPEGLTWDNTTTRESLDERFGPPHRKDCDDRDEIRFYQFDHIEYEFEFSPPEEPLKRINIYPSA